MITLIRRRWHQLTDDQRQQINDALSQLKNMTIVIDEETDLTDGERDQCFLNERQTWDHAVGQILGDLEL